MDEQVELLRGIWNELKTVNGRITKTNEALGELRVEVHDGLAELRGGLVEVRGGLVEVRGGLVEVRGGLAEVREGLAEVRDEVQVLGERIEAVHRRSMERDMRLAGDLHDLKLDVRDMKDVVFAWHDEHRAERSHLEERVERLEQHVGIGRR